MEYRTRALRPSDAADVLAAFQSDPQMNRQGNVHDLASAKQYVAWLQQPSNHAFVAVGPLADSSEERAVALAGITIDAEDGSGWVFYWAHRDARGRGITSALVKERCDWALASGLTDCLELGYRVNNPASKRVADHAGFEFVELERGKFEMDGTPVDAVLAARRRGKNPHPLDKHE